MAKAALYEERVNTSFIGYFLIGFILLLLGVIGFESGNLFGDDSMKWPVNVVVFTGICSIVGLVLLILTVFTYRTGQKTSAALFAIFGTMLFIVGIDWIWTAELGSSNWFLYIAFAILLLIVAIYSFLEEDSKLVGIMLIVLAIVFFFFALAVFFDPSELVQGPGNDLNMCHTMSIVYGVISIIGFALATYIGLAQSQPDRLPLI